MLTFLADPDETHVPLSKRSKVYVCHEGKRIATIARELGPLGDHSETAGNSTAIWKAKLHHKQFDPFMHEHEEHETKPHVLPDEDGRLSLHNPNSLSISDARQWVRENYIHLNGESSDE